MELSNSVLHKITSASIAPKPIKGRRSVFAIGNYLTLKNVLNVLLLSVVILEFYQPASNLLAEAKKSKKYVVVKEIGTTYKKVPVYKKVPMKVLKVVIKKKKSEKPWKKWFKKEMIVKIPKEKKHHHHYHHAASEGHQTWALPAFISAPSSMSEIFEAWPNDYNSNNGGTTVSNSIGDNIKQMQQQQHQQHQQQQQQQQSQQQTMLPTSVHDLKSVGSEEYPAFLADAAAQLVQQHLNGYPPFQLDINQQQQHDQQLQQDSRLLGDQIASLTHLSLGGLAANINQLAGGIQAATAASGAAVGAASAPAPTTTLATATTSPTTGSANTGSPQTGTSAAEPQKRR